MSDASKDASTINAQDAESGSHDDEQNHLNESDVEQHFKSGNNQSIYSISNIHLCNVYPILIEYILYRYD